jgi:hypothetical protein
MLTDNPDIAVIRRRKARSLADIVRSWKSQTEREDLAVCTHPVTTGLAALIASLQDVSTEGGTRAALRMLRNTLLDGGWNAYRSPEACETAASLLDFLAAADTVTSSAIDGWFAKLSQAGLKPVAHLMRPAAEDELEQEEAEEEVSR